jgi:hypothetical protein
VVEQFASGERSHRTSCCSSQDGSQPQREVFTARIVRSYAFSFSLAQQSDSLEPALQIGPGPFHTPADTPAFAKFPRKDDEINPVVWEAVARHDRTALVTYCGRICIFKKKINLSTSLAGQAVGIKEVDDGIWLVTFMDYDLGYIDLE